MDEIETAARRIVERVVLRTGGCFDYAADGEWLEMLVHRAHLEYIPKSGVVALMVREARREALTRLRDALSFEALAKDYRNLMGDLIPVETMIPNLRRHFGHAAHRAQSICTEQLRRLG